MISLGSCIYPNLPNHISSRASGPGYEVWSSSVASECPELPNYTLLWCHYSAANVDSRKKLPYLQHFIVTATGPVQEKIFYRCFLLIHLTEWVTVTNNLFITIIPPVVRQLRALEKCSLLPVCTEQECIMQIGRCQLCKSRCLVCSWCRTNFGSATSPLTTNYPDGGTSSPVSLDLITITSLQNDLFISSPAQRLDFQSGCTK